MYNTLKYIISNERYYRHIIKSNDEYTDFLTNLYALNDIDEMIYLFQYDLTEPPTCNYNGCTLKKIFNKKWYRYSSGCCSSHSSKNTCIKNHGVENPMQNTDVKNKTKEMNLKKYGVENPSQSQDIKQKKKETCLKNHGVENPMQNEHIKKNFMTALKENGGIGFQTGVAFETMKKRYNHHNPSQVVDFQLKKQKTSLINHGVSHPSQSETVKKKKMQQSLDAFGVEFVFQSELIKTKIKKTNIDRYGVENPSQSKNLMSTKMRMQFVKKMESLKNIVIPLFTLEEYTGISKKYRWLCVNCRGEFSDHLDDGHIPRCRTCYPVLAGSSFMETEIFEFISHQDKIKNDRTVLNGKELDILIPSKNIAIEFNGIYWHSEIQGKDEKYHLSKTNLCLEKGIQLIHIFESEWIERREIVKSILNSKLGIYKEKIYARRTTIKEISSKEKSIFLKENHLQGNDSSSIRLGLFYEDELVAVMTFGRSRFDKKIQYEMHRFCNKKGSQIIGGASKLFKYFIRNYNPTSIVTYADRRYSDGSFYEKIGFKLSHISAPNFWIFGKNIMGLDSRQNWQKHKLKDKLEIFDENLTAWENMQINGYDRIWDCGNFVFRWNC